MNATSTPITPAPIGNPKRKKALTTVAAVVVLAGISWGAYEWLVASHYESTDNAYVQGNVVQITPQISGTVMAILADDTDFVKAGQPLVKLDPADAKLALDQSEAALAQTVRQVRTLYANNGALAAQISLREADAIRAHSDVVRTQSDLARSQGDVARATDDFNRRQSLVSTGAVSTEELNHAQSVLNSARNAAAAAQAQVNSALANVNASKAGVLAAQEQLSSNQAMTDGTRVENHPSVQAAAAKVREAWLATQRSALPAPVDGFVAKRSVQLGQRVAAARP